MEERIGRGLAIFFVVLAAALIAALVVRLGGAILGLGCG